MNFRRPLAACLCVWTLAAFVAPAEADSPWQRMTLFKKLEADPYNAYRLSEQQGPWLILATTFTGEQAADDAQKLVYELRSSFKLPAYSHRMDFDFQAGTKGRGVDQFGAPKKMKYRVTRATEVAVLIGDFSALDDPQARKTLDKVRYFQPDCMTRKGEEQTWTKDRTVKGWRSLQQALTRGKDGQTVGPMAHAFITSNPLIPDDYFKPKGLDKMIVDMNKPLKHSLIHCPGKYSVRVATFGSPAIPIVGEDKEKEAQATRIIHGTLEDAAEKAHKLSEALRAKGYEAWEFHDRTSSMVCVGSFDSVGSPRTDGKIEINPQIHLIMETFGAEKKMAPGQAPIVGQPKTMVGVTFDVQPLPVEVPRASISADYTAGR